MKELSESSFGELLTKDKSFSIHHRNIQFVAIEMFKFLNGLSPSFMQDIFIKKESLQEHITRSNDIFIHPSVNTVYNGENSLLKFGPIVWDKMLPNKYKNFKYTNRFKKNIKTWLPTNCVCTLCKPYLPGIGFTWERGLAVKSSGF